MIKVFSGTEMSVNLLNEELEQIGIIGFVQNENNSGLLAGFYGGGPGAVDLFVQESDLEKAEPIINDFILRDIE